MNDSIIKTPKGNLNEIDIDSVLLFTCLVTCQWNRLENFRQTKNHKSIQVKEAEAEAAIGGKVFHKNAL